MSNQDDNQKISRTYPIVGRIDDVDLEKYTVVIQVRKIIDYDKIKNEDPELYRKVIENENKPDPYDDLPLSQ